MILDSLKVRQFRNLDDQDLEFHPRANLFVGDNGQGKTNFLEAIYFLATTKSFRTSKTANLVRLGADRVFAAGTFTAERVVRSLSIGIDLAHQRRRELQINGQKARLHDYLDLIHPFAYSAARLEIIRGGPEERRRFLDRGIASLRTGHLAHLTRYQKALQQRNALLREIGEGRGGKRSLDSWDVELVEAAAPIVAARASYVEKLVRRFRQVVEAHDYHVRDLEIGYEPAGMSGNREEDLALLERTRSRDVGAGFTTTGPHRDNVAITIRSIPADEFLSSGETKMTVLFLKLSKIELYRDERQDAPIFVLDDIDAELDIRILRRLFGYILDSTQLFTSSAKEIFFREFSLGAHRKFTLEKGAVTGRDDASA
ncbi:MAG: DNA replication and repair protein RecF [Thermoanaerobaculia bacterium]